MKARVAVLISGNGSNLQALIDACAKPDFPAEITGVISNRDDAYGLNRARDAGIPCHVIKHENYATREAFDRKMHEQLLHHSAQIVCLAGFMRLLTPWFVNQWRGRLLNIHPSLLPKYKGANAVRDALTAGETITGCTAHFVTEEMDSGEIIAQAEVPVKEGDTVETLTERVRATEHRVYPQALKKVAGTLG